MQFFLFFFLIHSSFLFLSNLLYHLNQVMPSSQCPLPILSIPLMRALSRARLVSLYELAFILQTTVFARLNSSNILVIFWSTYLFVLLFLTFCLQIISGNLVSALVLGVQKENLYKSLVLYWFINNNAMYCAHESCTLCGLQRVPCILYIQCIVLHRSVW